MKYTDPTGHVVACDNDDWACQHHWDEPITYDDSDYELDNIVKKVKKRIPRPVNGVHAGISVQSDVVLGGGGYIQGDLLFDWQQGTLYSMGTAGSFGYAGTPSVISGEGYVGFTSVYGIPNEPKDISDILSGENWDGAVEIGGDAIGKIGFSKGLSVDLDSTHKPVHTRDKGYQYAVETSAVAGFNLVPNAIEAGGETGFSRSAAFPVFTLPWWPFR